MSRPTHESLRRLAARRMGYITPSNAAKVLGHDRYWTAEFCQLFFEHAELLRFDDPAAAAVLLRLMPELLRRVRVGDRAGQFADPAAMASLEVRSWALLADCERLRDRPSTARRAVERARALAAAAPRVSLLAAAEVYRRGAALAIEGGGAPASGEESPGPETLERARAQLVAARGLLQPASGVVEAHAPRAHAETLLMIGGLPARDRRAGLAELAEALAFSRPHEPAGSAVFEAALDLLEPRLGEQAISLRTFDQVGFWLKLALKQRLPRHDRLCRPRLLWSEGRVLSALGVSQLAERRLSKVWQLLADLDEPVRLALVTLDLVMLDAGRDDRRSAARRLEQALERLDGAPPRSSPRPEEIPELLRQARSASLTTLQVFRRRLARRLPESRPPRALVPRPRCAPAAALWPLPSIHGVVPTESLEARLVARRSGFRPGNPPAGGPDRERSCSD
ncbi:MAG: hypothetical protein AAF725_06060 [Acidobacteriota bacterium]